MGKLAALFLVLGLGSCGAHSGGTGHASGNYGPRSLIKIMSSAQLKAEAQILRQPIYWAGPMKGFRYEFRRRIRGGDVYVRYLPRGETLEAGAKDLIVGTYPFTGAFDGLKRAAKGRAVAGPRGSIIYVRPGRARSAFVAFPGVDYQIEVYAPNPAVAKEVAGRVRPVG